jgi:hypothetical protein
MVALLGGLVWGEVLGLNTLLGISCASIVAMMGKREPATKPV